MKKGRILFTTLCMFLFTMSMAWADETVAVQMKDTQGLYIMHGLQMKRAG